MFAFFLNHILLSSTIVNTAILGAYHLIFHAKKK